MAENRLTKIRHTRVDLTTVITDFFTPNPLSLLSFSLFNFIPLPLFLRRKKGFTDAVLFA